MSQLVVVETILWAGAHGGAIFNGTATDGSRYRFVAGAEVMPRSPLQGEAWEISGTRRRHPEHGHQVEVNVCRLQRPSGNLITKVLSGSKDFPGIGVVTAKKLWDEFGEGIYELLDRGESTPFLSLIGDDLTNVLIVGWRELTIEANVYRWLDSHGVPLWIAKKLLAIYQNDVVEKLEENPYRLLAFTSWTQADRLGRSAGIAQNDERRLAAAADAVVYSRLRSHHTSTIHSAFVDLLGTVLGPGCNAKEAFKTALSERAVIEVDQEIQGLGPHSMEAFIAEKVAEMARGDFQSPQMTIRQTPSESTTQSLISKFEAGNGLVLNEQQKGAIQLAVSAPLAIISGSAGVGKTTVLSAICDISETLGAHVFLLALSGRAARRMEEATGRTAQTIASWLSQVDEDKLELDTEPTIAIDESSMLDLPTTYRILRRLEPGCRLLLLGDPGQLPPIGFGLVYHALVENASVPKVELTTIMRQAASTGIPQVSRDIRAGRVPGLSEYCGRGSGVSFIDCREDQIVDRILDVVNDLGGVEGSKIIGATKQGVAGVKTINHVFHQLLSPGRPARGRFAVGEPVIWLRNDHDMQLLNGSLGTVVRADQELAVLWDNGEKVIDSGSLVDMDWAYAITVHKAQGSQFPRVVIPIYQSRLLDRSLLYTAVTRAQSQVVLVGDRSAFDRAVTSPPSPSRRQTAIGSHLERVFKAR